MAAAALIAGTALSVYGSVKSNEDKAEAERQNQIYYQEQAQYAQHIGDRERALFQIKADEIQAAQVGGYAKAGVEMTGSPLAFLEQQAMRKALTDRAMDEETRSRVRLATLKGDQSGKMSGDYSSFTNQFLSAAPTALSAAGSYYKNAQGA